MRKVWPYVGIAAAVAIGVALAPTLVTVAGLVIVGIVAFVRAWGWIIVRFVAFLFALGLIGRLLRVWWARFLRRGSSAG